MMMDSFSVMTVNVWNHPYMRAERFEALCALIDAEQPDVLLTQETPMRPDGTTLLDPLKQRGLSIHAVALWDPADRIMVEGYESANAILSSHRLTDTGVLCMDGGDGLTSHVPYATVQIAGVPVHVLSMHGAWGANKGAVRLGQAMALSKHAEEVAGDPSSPTGIVIAGGDFNSEAHSDEIRFLTGAHTVAGDASFWVDSWACTNPDGRGATKSGSNPNALRTAQDKGIIWIPERRIDFLFAYGWVYGRAGAPEQTRVLDGPYGGVHVSDHYPVITRFRI